MTTRQTRLPPDALQAVAGGGVGTDHPTRRPFVVRRVHQCDPNVRRPNHASTLPDQPPCRDPQPESRRIVPNDEP